MPENSEENSVKEKNEPFFYHFSGKILEIKKADPEEKEKYILENEGIIYREISLREMPKTQSILKSSYKDIEFHLYSKDDFNFLWGADRPVSGKEKQEIEKRLQDPYWDVVEYDARGAVITRLNGYRAPSQKEILSSLECFAKEPFQTGGTIKEALDPDLHRRTLDSIIAQAQRKLEEMQQPSKNKWSMR